MHSLKVICCVACLIDLNNSLALFPGATLPDTIGMTKLSEILLNSMPARWSKQACVQGFGFEPILVKNILMCFSKWVFLNLFMKVP